MIDIVIPTLGRASLPTLLASLATSAGPLPNRIIIVDDRTDPACPLVIGNAAGPLTELVTIVRGAARGPAAARNLGWQASTAAWVAFLDDDVFVSPDWLADLSADLLECPLDAAASQGRVEVPLPTDRRPTDWERNVAGLVTARWITADCAYRRSDLIAVGGFDERFPRAFREDADIALRCMARGRNIALGRRHVTHPVRPAAAFVSIGLQAGNADDVLMEALHGADWYERAGAPRGAYRRHVWTVALALTSLASGFLWLVTTLAFACRRIAPGPRTPAEILAMLVTSIALPFSAVWFRLAGYAALPVQLASVAKQRRRVPRAVLFDRDGTLVEDVPYNGEPAAVRPVHGAAAALDRLRAAGIAIGIVSNQSGISQRKISADEVAAVNARIVELLGPIDTIQICPHDSADGCRCRKPAPGMIVEAARELGLTASQCVVIGDIGADIDAARAAGAGAILVPTAVTRTAEISAARIVAGSLSEAVDMVLAGRA